MDNASNQYLRNAIMTASPEQLHLMLYDGAIRFTRQGIEGIEKKNWERAFNGLNRAQKIILELINSLNYDIDRDLCTRMSGLYNFIYRKLVDAGTHQNADTAREALKILEYQRQTWVMVIGKLQDERSEGQESMEISPQEYQPEAAIYGALSVEG